MYNKLLGKILDRKYELVRFIGEGGMGAVYEAKHILLHHSVAVKILHAKYAKNPTLVERFVREAQAASAIGHPNITKAIDFGEERGGMVYIVMELLNGENLLELIRRIGRVPPSKAVTIILQVLSALKYAHQKGIVHRDLKPDNVFLAIDPRMREEVKLLDFGVVKFMDSDDEAEFGLTQPGTVVGTPNYLSPEQARGMRDIDKRIDIWSVGVMLYESLSGELPFQGESYNEILGKVLLEDPPPLESLVPDVPPGLVEVVSKALSKDRDDRYQDVDEFIEALVPYQDMEDRENMSTNVIDALKVPGISKKLKRGIPKGNTTGPEQRTTAVAPENGDTDRSHADEVEGKTATVSVIHKPSARKRTLFALAFVFAAATAIAFFYLERREPAISPVKSRATSAGGRLATSTAEKKPSPVTAEKPQSPKKIDSKTASEDKTEAAPVQSSNTANVGKPGNVTIHLKGLPEGAEITLDRKRVQNPIETTQSRKHRTLRIKAPGYKPYRRVVIPSRDKHVQVSMKKAQEESQTGRASEKQKRKRSSKKTEKKRGQVWTSNPFSSKTK